MKKVLHLTLLFLFPLLGFSNSPNHLSGIWYNDISYKEIRLKSKKYGLKVKGIQGIRGWRKFEKRRRNVFRDCDGNKIKVISQNSIKYVSNCGNYVIWFHKNRRQQSYCMSSSYGDHNYYSNYAPSPRHRQFYVRELDEYVDLEFTNFGLRARRLSGSWTEYRQNRFKKNEYTDKRGNRYLKSSGDRFKWISNDGLRSYNLTQVR